MIYVSEIRMFAGTFAPVGWEFCEGQLLPIAENDVLFTILGTTYGGDGESNFALPDLRGRLPIHNGNGHVLGEAAGVEEVTLTTGQIPSHTHPLVANASPGTLNSPSNAITAGSATIDLYRETSPGTAVSSAMVSPMGGSQPHTNVMPYVCVNFIISLYGVFPYPT
jgi:microcystin-dependent protein